MQIDTQNQITQPQSSVQAFTPEENAERSGGPASNTSLLEVKDQVSLSPEGRALLARMEESGAADA